MRNEKLLLLLLFRVCSYLLKGSRTYVYATMRVRREVECEIQYVMCTFAIFLRTKSDKNNVSIYYTRIDNSSDLAKSD